jgi:hypothetical protein
MALTIREALALPKRVEPPGRRRNKTHPSHRQWDLALAMDAEIGGVLVVGIRINVDLPESFSLLLRYQPHEGPAAILLRVNGDHGPHKNPDGRRFLEGSHVHAPLEADLDLPLSVAGAWAEGPPFATPLEPQIVRLTEGWRVLSERATILQTAENRRIIEKIAAGDAQMGLF